MAKIVCVLYDDPVTGTIREKYLIVDGGKVPGTGAHSYSAGNGTRGSEEAAKLKNLILEQLLRRIRGAHGKRPAAPRTVAIAWAGLGACLGILTLALAGARMDITLLLGSFGASCVLLFGYPEVPFSQPANVILGHFIGAAVGLFFWHVCGTTAWSLGLAVGVAIVAMMATRTVHPPAGSNPVIVFISHPGWSFLLFPVLAGAVLLTIIALLFHSTVRKRTYPVYW